MKQKKIPMRSCIVTREKLPKEELIRIVKNNNNEVFVDFTKKANGRGAYIKKDIVIVDKLKKSKILDKHLEIEIPESIFIELEELLNNK